MVSEETSLTTSPRDALSSWCGRLYSLESSTFSMVLQQMMLPILLRASFQRRPGDVVAELSRDAVQLLQAMVLPPA